MSIERIYTLLDAMQDDLKNIRAEQANIRNELTKYKSFWGGILFTFTSISALLAGLWTYVKDMWH